MSISTHELAKQLLKFPDTELTVSIDISTCEEDSELRAFGFEYDGTNGVENDGSITLLFTGNTNY